jgi:hypothetical protein
MPDVPTKCVPNTGRFIKMQKVCSCEGRRKTVVSEMMLQFITFSTEAQRQEEVKNNPNQYI